MAWMLAASMARRLISLPEAAGTPEGGKVLGRAARRWTQCSRLVRMTQSRLPVSSLLKCTGVLCRCRRRRQVAGRACCGYARRDESRHEGERGLRGRSRDTSPDCLAAPSRKGSSPTATCARGPRAGNRPSPGPRRGAAAAAPAPTTGAAAAPATAARKGTPSAPVVESRGRGASGARSPCQRGTLRTASRARPTPGGSC